MCYRESGQIRTGLPVLVSHRREPSTLSIPDDDITRFGRHCRGSFEAQIAMFRHIVTPAVARLIREYYGGALPCKLSRAAVAAARSWSPTSP